MKFFENPDCLPLEELQLKIKDNGVVQCIPALDKWWAEERYFLHYEAPNIYDADGKEIEGAKDRWIEIVTYIIHDLKWLLNLPFYRFWSNVVNNPSILDSLVSFLQEAPPFYALENFPNNPGMLDLLELLRRYVLVVFARFITNKESPEEYMSDLFLGNLLYEQFIFTVPIIFDLCQLYGRENSEAIENILTSLFKLEKLYYNDLHRALPCLIEAFENVEVKFKDCPVQCNQQPVSLQKKNDTSKNFTLFQLEDMVLYVLDISTTITVLLKNHPPVINVFHTENFMMKIVSLYSNTIPEMYKRLDKMRTEENIPKYIEMKHRLDVTRIELIHLFRSIIYEPALSIRERINTDKVTETQLKEIVEDYIDFLCVAIAEKEFITDYNQFYPVDCDLQMLSRLWPGLDSEKCNYILKGIAATTGEMNNQAAASSSNLDVAGASGIQNMQPGTSSSNVHISDAVEEMEKANAKELATLVSKVKDILQDLDEYFIEMCLKHYEYNVESVILAVLEDNLPPDLKLSRKRHTKPLEDMATTDEELAYKLSNASFSDQEDEDLRTIVPKVIEVPKNYIIRNYSLVVDEYDDEHDDTYDSCDVRDVAHASLDVDTRPFTTPRVFMTKQKKEFSENDTDVMSDDDTTIEQNNKDHFIQDPAELRAKAEQRRQSMRGGKHIANVAGKPKGQGQDKDVQHNRQNKNVHKATSANHNRRSGAQAKRRQGMISS